MESKRNKSILFSILDERNHRVSLLGEKFIDTMDTSFISSVIRNFDDSCYSALKKQEVVELIEMLVEEGYFTLVKENVYEPTQKSLEYYFSCKR